jgi:hypothetical protein
MYGLLRFKKKVYSDWGSKGLLEFKQKLYSDWSSKGLLTQGEVILGLEHKV